LSDNPGSVFDLSSGVPPMSRLDRDGPAARPAEWAPAASRSHPVAPAPSGTAAPERGGRGPVAADR